MTAGPQGLRWRLGLLALAVLAGALVSHSRLAAWADAQAHDVLTRWLPARAAPAQLVLVDIDEASLAELGPWPWPRPLVAQLVRSLRERGARLQVWDAFFPDPTAGDSALQAAVSATKTPDVVWGQVLVLDPLVQTPPRVGELRATPFEPAPCATGVQVTGHLGVAPGLSPALVGHLTSTPDSDGRLRRLPAVLCRGDERFPQLVIAAAQALEPGARWVLRDGAFPFGPTRWLERGGLEFALDADGRMPVPYHRPHGAWPAISAARLLDASASTMPLKDAIVVVGATALGVSDAANTPRHPHAPGVSVHAELLGAALEHAWVVRPQAPGVVAGLVIALVGLFIVPFANLRNRPLWLVGGVALAFAAPMLAAALGRLAGSMLPVAGPALALTGCVLGMLLLQAGAERRQAQRLAAHLESFLPRGLARDIALQDPSGESLGKPCNGVLMALRVVGLERWTVSVDTLQALALVHAVNTVVERCVQLHGGALEHVQGEVLLVAWPQPDAAGVHSAIAAAVELQKSLGELLQRNESPRYPLGVRVAIDTGAFLLGVAGSRSSRRPLLLGPAADVVLAMLALSDELASPILVGAGAALARPGDTLHPLGQFLLPDQPQATPLYRVDA